MSNQNTEKSIEQSIVEYLNAFGYWAAKIQSGKILKAYKDKNGDMKQFMITLAPAGTPDILACVKGRFVSIEVKKDEKEYLNWKKQKDQRSKDQHHQQALIRKAGGITLVVHSLEQAIEDLADMGLH